MNNSDKYCGYVALLGKPNVGKSTLLNRLLGQKVSITSRKPQTTRHQITGIVTEDNYQTIFVDTPGLQQTFDSAIHRYMNRAASSTIRDVDLIVLVVDRLAWNEQDEHVLSLLDGVAAPVILVLNKVDRLVEKHKLLPHMQTLSSRRQWADIIPVSAKSGHNIDQLQNAIRKRLPERAHLFDEEQVTDRSQRFLAAELIREKIMRQMGDELPHKVAVQIESFQVEKKITRISAIIWVERESQKKMIIGRGGERIKEIGIQAREDIEVMLDAKVMLNLWAKVKSSWSDDDQVLKSLGYAE